MTVETTVPTQAAPWPAPEATPRSPYHLTPEQIRFFDDNGYLVLRRWIPPGLLARLQAAGEAWIQSGLRATEADPHYPDYAFVKRPSGRLMYRVNYVHNKGQPASLELLGCPQVLAVAESLCGPNFVPTYESMVFKMEGDGAAIRWHQDAVHPRRYRIYNYDVYLDASRTGAGALRVIPKSQTQKQDICYVKDSFGWEPPGVVSVEMEPGDVLLHDVMIVHGSEATHGAALRRTIYYEFRAAEEILAEGPWDREWIERRLRLLPMALQRYREAFPDGPQFQWNIAPEFRPRPQGDQTQELRIVHTGHMPGTWCSAGDAGTGSKVAA